MVYFSRNFKIIYYDMKKLNVIDLFSGVGGLSYGFYHNDKFKVLAANEILPDIDYSKEVSEESSATAQFTFDENFINALISKAYNEGVDILNVISEKIVRAKAKSGLVKAKRAGSPPHASPESLDLVNQFLSGGTAPAINVTPKASPAPAVPEDILINQYINYL